MIRNVKPCQDSAIRILVNAASSPTFDNANQPTWKSATQNVELNISSEEMEGYPTVSTTGSEQPEDPRGELAIVEQEVERVSAILSSLVIRRHMLKEHINELYSPFIRMLPLEIIAEIFMCCLPIFNSTQDTPASGDDLSFSPFRFGAVCSSWRRIAWSTPILWSTLAFRLTSPLKIHSQIGLIEEWLSRSGQMPLSIRLSSSEDASWTGVSTEGLMKVIGVYASRWENLDIRLPSSCYKYLPTSDDAAGFPLLDSLVLKPPGGQGDRVHKVNMPTSPRLRYLSLSCLYLRSVVFHFGVLTHIDLESFYIDELLEMLRQSLALVILTAKKVLGGDDRHDPPEEPIVLENLEEMCIVNDKGADIQLFLNKITTPKLTTLSYTSDNLMTMPSAEIIALVKRSGCYLDSVSILQAPVREEPLQIFLAALPSLTSLTLSMPTMTSANYAPLTDNILQTLDPTYASANKMTVSLPELKSLTYTGGQGFTWKTFLRVIESRCPSAEIKDPSLQLAGAFDLSEGSSSTGATESCVSFIRNVQVTLSFAGAEEGMVPPQPPCATDLESLGLRGVNLEIHQVGARPFTTDPAE